MSTYVGDERKTSFINGIPIGYYYYLIPRAKAYSATYLGYVDTIQSVTFNPFIEEGDITSVCECTFNSDTYGIPEGGIPKCYRIESFDNIDKRLFSKQIFQTRYNNNGFDPKLQLYPYRYFLITDYSSNPLLIKPQLISSNDGNIYVSVKTTPLSSQTKYNIYVENYKYDGVGNLEGMCNSNALMLPVTSNVYSQFLATSSASFNQNIVNAMLENDKTLQQGTALNSLNNTKGTINNLTSGVSSLLNLFTGNIGGAIGGLINSGVNQYFLEQQTNLSNTHLQQNHQYTEYEINATAQAKVTDMLNTPNSIKTSGNDTLFNLINGGNKIDMITYVPHIKVISRLNLFFSRYGYKYNTYASLGNVINSRKYFNYVKTNICNIATAKVPNEYLEEIKQIFNNGMTIWHISNGAEVLNYDIGDNSEV